MTQRVLTPELLDSLPSDHPDAVRSRADLRRINIFMGNHRWLKRQIAKLGKSSDDPLHLIELGAGDGSFLESFIKHPKISTHGIDLIEKPSSASSNLGWTKGDIFELENFPWKKASTNIVICNLILHHFTDQQLAQLGSLLEPADHILAVEPHRSTFPKLLGRLSFPLINKVTKHDMMVSIEAGFRLGELAPHFPHKEITQESSKLRGSLRIHFS